MSNFHLRWTIYIFYGDFSLHIALDILPHHWSSRCHSSSFLSQSEQPFLTSYMEGKTLISRQTLSLQLLGLWDLTVGLRSYLLTTVAIVSTSTALCFRNSLWYQKDCPLPLFLSYSLNHSIYIIFPIFPPRIFKCLYQERAHVSWVYHSLGTRVVLLWIFLLPGMAFCIFFIRPCSTYSSRPILGDVLLGLSSHILLL